MLVAGTEFYRLVSGSTAINTGIGSYPFLVTDITDGPRTSNFDAGAEEFNSGGANLPYSIEDVGTKLGFGALETLSFQDYNIDKELKIYPNPVKGNLYIALEDENIGNVEVVDLLGRTVQQNYIAISTGEIDLTNLPTGTYIVKIKNRFKRIIKYK